MKNRTVYIVLLIYLFLGVLTGSYAQTNVPENAQVLGNAWYCNTGFKRVGGECQKLNVPEEEQERDEKVQAVTAGSRIVDAILEHKATIYRPSIEEATEGRQDELVPVDAENRDEAAKNLAYTLRYAQTTVNDLIRALYGETGDGVEALGARL